MMQDLLMRAPPSLTETVMTLVCVLNALGVVVCGGILLFSAGQAMLRQLLVMMLISTIGSVGLVAGAFVMDDRGCEVVRLGDCMGGDQLAFPGQ